MFEVISNWPVLLSALLTPVIAIFGAFIAYQQWAVNRANLKERLFERRLKIFTETQTYLTEILRDTAISDDSMWKFNDTHQKARFLFGKKMQNYLKEIRLRSIKMGAYARQLKDIPVGDERTKLVTKEYDELKWLNDQINVIFDVFEPYLSFENYK